MPSPTISLADLERLLAVYQVYEQERQSQNGTPFLKLLNWVEEKQPSPGLQEHFCQPGEIIIQENEPGEIFYLIRSGQAVVIKGDFQTPTILGFRSRGDAIGEMALLENLPRSATVVALNEMSLWCLGREMFYQFLSENPTFGLDLLNMLSWRIRESDEERMRGVAREKQQVQALESLSKQATRDALTGLFNRRHLDKSLRNELSHARQAGTTVGILMLDVDHFKKINDRYGHKAGDLVLQALARLLKKSVRAADIVCRYGGEEFVIILPGVSLSTLSRSAEEIRAKCQAMRVTYLDQEIQATISLGAVLYPQHGAHAEELIVHADQALYRSKEQGRNRMTIYLPQDSEKAEN